MSSVISLFQALLPPRAKKTPSGWISFNAPCCHRRGHGQDKRKRAGVTFEDGITYNCFNCKFTATWKPGRHIGSKFRSLLQWLGASDNQIKEIVFEALKTEKSDSTYDSYAPLTFETKKLPEGSIKISDMKDSDQLPQDLVEVARYIYDRGFYLDDYDFYWSPESGFADRLILPFYYDGEIVGYTARKISNGRPKYLSDQTPNYVFNIDQQQSDQKYIFVVEGPFDAIAIDGVAVLTNRISDLQATLLKSYNSQVIVIPDQDQAGVEMIDSAVEHGFAVAFPNWGDDIKDVADAVNKYGSLYVIVDAIQSSTDNKIKINVNKNHFKKHV